MKKTLFILSVALLSLASCKNSKKSVIGKWKIFEMNISSMSDEEKKDAMDSTTIEFNADGQFVNNTRRGKMTGTYVYTEKDSTLTVTNPGGQDSKAQKFTIGWEDGKMVMTNGEGVVKLKKE